MVTIDVNIDGAVRKFELAAEAASDLTPALRRFGAYWRTRAVQRYKEQNFEPLAESTIAKRAQRGFRRIERKLQKDVARAVNRVREKRGESALLKRLTASATARHALMDAVSGLSRGVQNRAGVLAEFQRAHRRSLKDRVQGAALSNKQKVGLAQREARAVARELGKPILGGLARTVTFQVRGTDVELASRTHQQFSEAHNKGARVGHGAQLPARETIKLEPQDVEVLMSILKDHGLMAFQEGTHGPGY